MVPRDPGLELLSVVVEVRDRSEICHDGRSLEDLPASLPSFDVLGALQLGSPSLPIRTGEVDREEHGPLHACAVRPPDTKVARRRHTHVYDTDKH